MNNSTTIVPTIDPVCGMTIDPAHAAGTSKFEGMTFHFCATACKNTFDAEPAKYAVSALEVTSSCCAEGHCTA